MRRRRALALGFLLAASGCGTSDGGEKSSEKTNSGDQPLAKPLEASCAQITFGSKRFPDASEKRNLQTAAALADAYRDAGSSAEELKVAFSVTLLGICNKTKDAAYRPVPQAQSIADEARKLSDQSGTDFAKTLAVAAAGQVRGKEEINADAAFTTSANRACTRASSGITPLIKKLNEPGSGAFKSSDAAQLKLKLTELAGNLTRLAQKSSAKDARSFASGFDRAVGKLGTQATQLAVLNEDYISNIARAAPLQDKLARKLIDLSISSGDAKACGDIFSGI